MAWKYTLLDRDSWEFATVDGSALSSIDIHPDGKRFATASIGTIGPYAPLSIFFQNLPGFLLLVANFAIVFPSIMLNFLAESILF
jgi:hypothetical protein